MTAIWSGAAPTDFDGAFYKLRGLEGSPAPFGNWRPVMMNAGASPAGRTFAIRNSDRHFDYCRTPEDSIARVREATASGTRRA